MDAALSMTQRQRALLDFLISEIDRTGQAPSLSEMSDKLGLASKSGAHRQLKGLQQRGWIRRPHHQRARAIQILHRPAELEANWLIWSTCHCAWWRACEAGYTQLLADAGRYTRQKALSICGSGRDGWDGSQRPSELPVRLEDAQAAAALGADARKRGAA